ncbi:hypothetical protein ACQ86E_17480 [Bradyrhizobium betae]|uniref:hypothetical protein n=1 Tax=Bradyrhizobium betae TaxID=244734 RepID=UPI003D66DE44
MTIEIQVINEVLEDSLKTIVKSFAQDGANIVTAINDTKGKFSVEATFIDPGPQTNVTISGKMSVFGGPQDMGVGPNEDLALYDASNVGTAPAGLFLAAQPQGTTGLARRLDPGFNYLACRWDYSVTPKSFLRGASVTVSANGKSVTANPADWGPNVKTGRIADLSPGLAHALHLDTDDTCTLRIPLPEGTQMEVPDTAPVVAVDIRAVTAAALPPNMAQTLIVITVFGDKLYMVVSVVGSQDGGQTLLRSVAGGAAEALLNDTIVLPVTPGPDIPETVAGELNKAVRKDPAIISGPAGTAPTSTNNARAKMFAAARAFVGHSTRNVPDTQNGNLACAWAVNEIARIALGKPISEQGHGENGLSTVGLFDALRANHTQLASKNDARPGDVIIAPTIGVNHGHTGIVGETNGGVDATQIFRTVRAPPPSRRTSRSGRFSSTTRRMGCRCSIFR